MEVRSSPYYTIWIHPRLTFIAFFANREQKGIYPLPFIFFGISIGLAMNSTLAETIELEGGPQAELMLLGFTSALAIAMIYLLLGVIQPFLIRTIGKIWNGQATQNELANVFSLAYIPYGLLMIYQIALLLTGQDPTLDQVNGGLLFVIWLLSIRNLVIGVAVVQQLNVLYALVNIVLSFLPFLLLQLMVLS